MIDFIVDWLLMDGTISVTDHHLINSFQCFVGFGFAFVFKYSSEHINVPIRAPLLQTLTRRYEKCYDGNLLWCVGIVCWWKWGFYFICDRKLMSKLTQNHKRYLTISAANYSGSLFRIYKQIKKRRRNTINCAPLLPTNSQSDWKKSVLKDRIFQAKTVNAKLTAIIFKLLQINSLNQVKNKKSWQ